MKFYNPSKNIVMIGSDSVGPKSVSKDFTEKDIEENKNLRYVLDRKLLVKATTENLSIKKEKPPVDLRF